MKRRRLFPLLLAVAAILTAFPAYGTAQDTQPFKFGGKELTLQNGLNEYDFGARQYYPAVSHFSPLREIYEFWRRGA